MSELTFEVLGARAERYASAPTLVFDLQVADLAGEQIHTIALRCQIRIEPAKRRYESRETELLYELFGETARWGDTLKPIQFANVAVSVPGFSGSTRVDLPVACTYDFEVAAAKYFHALRDGEVPLVLLFSGTIFRREGSGMAVEQVPWDREATFRLPVAVWRELMDLYFPNAAWIRMHRDTLDALQEFKSRRALPTWDATVEALLDEARARP